MGVYYNLRYWVQGNPMRNYVHPTREIEAVIRANGLQRRFSKVMGTGQVTVFARP